jgi:hypothetical protein
LRRSGPRSAEGRGRTTLRPLLRSLPHLSTFPPPASGAWIFYDEVLTGLGRVPHEFGARDVSPTGREIHEGVIALKDSGLGRRATVYLKGPSGLQGLASPLHEIFESVGFAARQMAPRPGVFASPTGRGATKLGEFTAPPWEMATLACQIATLSRQ